MTIINEDVLRETVEMPERLLVRVHTTKAGKGQFDKRFVETKSDYHRDGIAKELRHVLLYKIHGDLYFNKSRHTVELHLRKNFYMDESKRMLMNRILNLPNTMHNLSAEGALDNSAELKNHYLLYRLQKRVMLVAGLALTGTNPETYVVGTRNDYSNKHRVFKVDHQEVYEFLEEHMTFTEDFDKNFATAFDVLWFSLPINYTGEDDRINQAYMELITTAEQ